MSSGIRASDHDRDRTGRLLREHHAVGRLSPEEFSERLDKSFSAKTIEELDELTADLPAIDLYPLPTASLPRNRAVSTGLPADSVFRQASSAAASSGRFSPGWLISWGSWSVLLVIGFVVWLLGFGAVPLLGMAAIGVLMGGGWVMAQRSLGHGGRGPRPALSARDESADEIEAGSDNP